MYNVKWTNFICLYFILISLVGKRRPIKPRRKCGFWIILNMVEQDRLSRVEWGFTPCRHLRPSQDRKTAKINQQPNYIKSRPIKHTLKCFFKYSEKLNPGKIKLGVTMTTRRNYDDRQAMLAGLNIWISILQSSSIPFGCRV